MKRQFYFSVIWINWFVVQNFCTFVYETCTFFCLTNMVDIYPSCRCKASNFRKSKVRQRRKVSRKMATIFFARSERKDPILRGVVTFPLQLKQLVWRWAKNGWKILVGTRRSTFSFLSVVPRPLYPPRSSSLPRWCSTKSKERNTPVSFIFSCQGGDSETYVSRALGKDELRVKQRVQMVEGGAPPSSCL